MRRSLIAFSLLFTLLAVGFARGEQTGSTPMPDRTVEFYSNYIENKIRVAELESTLSNSPVTAARCEGEQAREKAAFLKGQKERLIDEMLRQEIGTKPYKIDYFLITSFNKAAGGKTVSVCKAEGDNGQG